MFLNRSILKAMNRRKTLAQAKQQEDCGGDSGGSGGGGGTDGAGGAGVVGLRRTLTAVDVVLYGVGSSVGAGIYVLVGLGAKIAGPAISLSFLGCGLACILTALAYAEFASRIPVSGSAFTYVYVAFGEFLAWVVGWFLILGYGFTASVVARAWADYTGDFLIKLFDSGASDTATISSAASKGIVSFLRGITEFPIFGSHVDYSCSPLSILIVTVSTFILLRGAKESSYFSNCMTILNISVLVLVILVGILTESINVNNLEPFVPHEIPSVLQGAGLVFFAFIGFDMVASLSEEVIHPEKNMPIGIVGSLVASTLIYVSVALAVVGMAPIELLGESVPIINAIMANACCTHTEQVMLLHDIDETSNMHHGFTSHKNFDTSISTFTNNIDAPSVKYCLHPNYCTTADHPLVHPTLVVISHIVALGAMFGLMTGTFTSLMGQPRIFYRMSQDGLWFQLFKQIDPKTNVPSAGIVLTGVVTSLLACFVPLSALANLISLGTLMVFTLVNAGVLLLRLRDVMNRSVTMSNEIGTPATTASASSTATTGMLGDSSTTATATTIRHTNHDHEMQLGMGISDDHQKQSQAQQTGAVVNQSKKSLRRRNRKIQNRVIYLLLLYTAALMMASILVSHFPDAAQSQTSSGPSFLMLTCLAVAMASGVFIVMLPPSGWSTTTAASTTSKTSKLSSSRSKEDMHHHYTSDPNTAINTTTNGDDSNDANAIPQTDSHDHKAFECPWTPGVPLGGIACNAFMMGSLPLSSWIFCAIWAICGIAFYFLYGIHHSVLGKTSHDHSSPHPGHAQTHSHHHHHHHNDSTPLLLRHRNQPHTTNHHSTPGGDTSDDEYDDYDEVTDGYQNQLNFSIRVVSHSDNA